MVNYMDDSISDVIAEMKTQQMYNDSLIVFSADK